MGPSFWVSVTVEGEAFDEAEHPPRQPLTDWRIVIAPPLVIENTLPIGGNFIVWERTEVTCSTPNLCVHL